MGNWFTCRRGFWLATVLVCLCAGTHASADVLSLQFNIRDGSSLDLLDGWNAGEDWDYSIDGSGDASAWIAEHWLDDLPVVLAGFIQTDGLDPDIALTKDLVNQTALDWTGFHIDLVPLNDTGPMTVDLASVSSDRFSDTSVMNNIT